MEARRNCEVIRSNFDVLPLIMFADDGLVEEVSVGGEYVELGASRDLYSYVSQMFYNICPELRAGGVGKDHYSGVDRGGRVKVGVVSAKLYNHEVLKTHGGLIKHLATNEPLIDLVIACFPTVKDPATTRIMREVFGSSENINLNVETSPEKVRSG